jgi:hypothetical protein
MVCLGRKLGFVGSELEVKGHVISLFVITVDELVGAEICTEMLRRGPRELQDALLYSSLVPGGWYPIAWYRKAHAELAALTPTHPQLPAQIGRRATEVDLAGPNRWLLKLLSLNMICSMTARTFGVYFRGGQARSERLSDGIRCEITDCLGMDNRILAEWSAAGQYVMELGGAKNVWFNAAMVTRDRATIRFYWEQ